MIRREGVRGKRKSSSTKGESQAEKERTVCKGLIKDKRRRELGEREKLVSSTKKEIVYR